MQRTEQTNPVRAPTPSCLKLPPQTLVLSCLLRQFRKDSKFIFEVKVSKVFVKSLILTMLAVIVLTACGTAAAPASTLSPAYPNSDSAYPNPDTAAAASFAKDVLPIFESSCFKCHGGDKTEKGLDLKTYASVMLGSQKGAVITRRECRQQCAV